MACGISLSNAAQRIPLYALCSITQTDAYRALETETTVR